MSNIKTMKTLRVIFLFFFFCQFEIAKADMSIENETPLGGDIKFSEYDRDGAIRIATSNCNSRGLNGLNRLTLLGLPTRHWEFECDVKSDAIYQNESTPTSQSNNLISITKNLDSYGADCKEIGFKPKTPAYGDCVLELRKRDFSNSTTQSKNSSAKNISSKAKGDGSTEDIACQRYGFRPQTDAYGQCRMQLDNTKKQMQAQQAQYEEQKRIYDQQQAQYEREKSRQKGLALLRYGSALASGTSPYFSDNVANANSQVFGTAPPPPRSRIQTYTIRLPNSKTMNCTYINNNMDCH
jgi:hypothetical protein